MLDDSKEIKNIGEKDFKCGYCDEKINDEKCCDNCNIPYKDYDEKFKTDQQKFEELLKEKNMSCFTHNYSCECMDEPEEGWTYYVQDCLCCETDGNDWWKSSGCKKCIICSFDGLACGGHYGNFRCFDNGKDVSNEYLDSGPVVSMSEIRLDEIKHYIDKSKWLDTPEIYELISWLKDFVKINQSVEISITFNKYFK